MQVLVTGASGFVGKTLCQVLLARGHKVRALSSTPPPAACQWILRKQHPIPWPSLLQEVEAVVHLGGKSRGKAEELWSANAILAEELAQALAQSQVRHVLFLSTAKVYGEGGMDMVREDTAPRPISFYAKSKLAAEEALKASRVPLAIFRVPPILGPEMKGNLKRLFSWAAKGRPILTPRGTRRALVALPNLVQVVCLAMEKKKEGVFVLADAHPTLAELAQEASLAAGKKAHVLEVPGIFFQYFPPLKRLASPFLLDDAKSRAVLGFSETADWRKTLHQAVSWISFP